MKAKKVQKTEPKLNKDKKGPSLKKTVKVKKEEKKTNQVSQNILNLTKKKELKNVLTSIAIAFMAVPLLAFSSNNQKAFENVQLEVKKDVEIKKGEVFDLDLLFNMEVNDVYFDVEFENVDETLEDREISFIKKYYDKNGKEVQEKEATYANKVKYGYSIEKILDSVGTYYVTIKNVNNEVVYKSILHVLENDEKAEEELLGSNALFHMGNYMRSCTASGTGRCDYFDVPAQPTTPEPNPYAAAAQNYGDVQTQLVYNNGALPQGGGGIYRSGAGFYSSNPIARDAINWVGTSGMNCEVLFQNVIRNNQELLNKTGGDINSVRIQVPLSEIQPGDELRYADGGVGLIHVAIYIGDGKAVHGGFYGTDTVIWDAFPAQASTPTVYRYVLD